MIPEIQRLLEAMKSQVGGYNVSIGGGHQTNVRAIVDVIEALLVSAFDNHHNALTCPYCNPKGLVLASPAGQEAPPTRPDRPEWQRGYQAGYSAGRKRVTLDPDEQRTLLCLFGGYLWIEQIALTQDALAAAVDGFVTLWSKDVPGSVAGADAPGPGGTVGDRGAGEGKPDV